MFGLPVEKSARQDSTTLSGSFSAIADDELTPTITSESGFDITIGQNVWFGARCIVLKGVTIGDNSVIAAGSIVVKSIPANCVAAGNPARVVKEIGKEVPNAG